MSEPAGDCAVSGTGNPIVPTSVLNEAENGKHWFPAPSVTAPAAMVTANCPSVERPVIVNCATVLPESTVAPVTVAPGIPERPKVDVVTELGLIASLKVTFKTNEPGSVTTLPEVGLVETTCGVMPVY